MATTTRVETRKRGFFGWIFALLFWGFNALMLLWLVLGAQNSNEATAALTNDAERAGAAIGTAIGIGMILFVWAVGAIVFGALSYFTRGNLVMVETTKD